MKTIICGILVFLAFMALSLTPLWAAPYVKEPRGFGLIFGDRVGSDTSFTVIPRKGWSRPAEIHCIGFDGKIHHSNFYMPAFEGVYAGHMFMPVDNAKCFIKESRP